MPALPDPQGTGSDRPDTPETEAESVEVSESTETAPPETGPVPPDTPETETESLQVIESETEEEEEDFALARHSACLCNTAAGLGNSSTAGVKKVG